MASFSSMPCAALAPAGMNCSFFWPLPVPKFCGSPMASDAATPPSTSGWLAPTNTLTEPSSAATWVVCTYLLISRVSWSRRSSRSLGAWPLPRARTISWFTWARSRARLFTTFTAPLSCSATASSISSMRPAPSRMRRAVSSMRVSTTPRAVRSVGELTTSENAFIMSLMAEPSPAAPPLNTSCNCLRRSRRALSPASVAAAALAWRVSRSLWLRSTVWMSTPLPM